MKSSKNISILVAGLITSMGVSANNIIRTDAPIRGGSAWSLAEPTVSEWAIVGDLYDCVSQNPSSSAVPKGLQFTQTYAGCKQDQQRSVQNNEVNRRTGETRTVGAPYAEVQSLTGLTGSRKTEGTMSVTSFTADIVAGAISVGANSGGVGYRRQQGGVYSFGSSMTAFGSMPVATNFVLYGGQYNLSVIAGQENVQGLGNPEVTAAARIFLSTFTRADLLSGDGTVVFSYALANPSCAPGYCMSGATVTKAEFDKWYAAPGIVKKVHLY